MKWKLLFGVILGQWKRKWKLLCRVEGFWVKDPGEGVWGQGSRA